MNQGRWIVTAPPGGLGHFVSRILAHDYDFEVSVDGSYHALEKNYGSYTTDIRLFDHRTFDLDHAVICCHNFNNDNFVQQFPTHTVVNIIVENRWEIYLNNFWRKSIQSNPHTESEYLTNIQKKFDHKHNVLREEFYWLYQSAVSGQITWLPRSMQGRTISFGDLYQWETFVESIQPLTSISEKQLSDIWTHFMQSQQPILTRVGYYHRICESMIEHRSAKIPDNFDNVDFGIICGMIAHQHQIDLLDLANDQWGTCR